MKTKTIACIASVLALTLAAPAAAHERLHFGTAVDTDVLASDGKYRKVLTREFNSVTAENAMKWESVEPERGELDFSAADGLVRFARRHRQSVYGHTLVWHNQLPAWLTESSFSDAELGAILRRHVKQEAGHFRGRVRAWDVVNEPFNEDGTWRDTLWYRALGPDYVAKALRWAHRADPRARLFLNDYNLEALGPKSDAMYALVADLKRRGVPIDGVGFQGHLSLEYPFPEGLEQNLRRFAALGVDVAFTEVDVRMPLPVTRDKLELQADYYAETMRACRAVRRCRTYTVWGFTDAHSWVPGWFPGEGAATLFDESYRPKPAYFAVKRARG